MLNQPLTLEEFRKLFPEIDSDSYPDIAVKARLALAAKFSQRKAGQIPRSGRMSWGCIQPTI